MVASKKMYVKMHDYSNSQSETIFVTATIIHVSPPSPIVGHIQGAFQSQKPNISISALDKRQPAQTETNESLLRNFKPSSLHLQRQYSSVTSATKLPRNFLRHFRKTWKRSPMLAITIHNQSPPEELQNQCHSLVGNVDE